MTSRSQIRALLAEITRAFNSIRPHTAPLPANTVVSWDSVAQIIGQPAVTYIRTADLVMQARQVITLIIEQGYNVTTDGKHVYTNMPIRSKAEWQAFQPALIKAIQRG